VDEVGLADRYLALRLQVGDEGYALAVDIELEARVGRQKSQRISVQVAGSGNEAVADPERCVRPKHGRRRPAGEDSDSPADPFAVRRRRGHHQKCSHEVPSLSLVMPRGCARALKNGSKRGRVPSGDGEGGHAVSSYAPPQQESENGRTAPNTQCGARGSAPRPARGPEAGTA